MEKRVLRFPIANWWAGTVGSELEIACSAHHNHTAYLPYGVRTAVDAGLRRRIIIHNNEQRRE
jgi:hypothetical protein